MEYKIDKDNYVFKSAVRGNTDHGWDIIGHVESTFLKINGEYVFNLETCGPYIVPVGYNPQDTLNNFLRFDDNNSVFQNLYHYKRGGNFDLQRNFNGKNFQGFVKDYTPIASLDFGLAVSAGGLSLTTGEIDGGIINKKMQFKH